MEGDQAAAEAAFEELYQAQFGPIYDFSIRLAQDRNIAALVVQSVFLRALRAFRAGQSDGLELQLYTAAHLDTAERLRGKRDESDQIEEPYAAIDVSRLSAPSDDIAEMGRLVWSAAVTLKLNDYELLDLGLRHKLNPSDIATVLRARSESVERKLLDAQAQLQQAFTARLLYTRGRRECLDLDFELGDAEWTGSLPRRIVRHADSCEVCKSTAANQLRAIELLGALMPVPAPAGWQQTILDRLKEAVRDEPEVTATATAGAAATGGAAAGASKAATPASASEQPEPTPASEQRQLRPLPEAGGAGAGAGISAWLDSIFGGGGPRGPLLAALLGGFLVFAVVTGSLCAAGTFDGDGGDDPDPTATVTITPTAEASGTPTVTTTPTETATLEPLPQPTAPPVPTEAPVPTGTPLPLPTATTVPPAPTIPAPTATVPAPKPSPTP